MRVNALNKDRNTINNEGRPVDVTFTGPLILFGNPIENRDAVNKGYVDSRFSTLNATHIKSGILPVGRLPSFTGDVTNVAGSNVFTLNPSGVTAGTYRKVTVDAKGRIIGSSALAASDVPGLNWTKITKNKPTTLTGYGIIDAINLNGDVVDGPLLMTAVPTQPSHAATRGYMITAAETAGGSVTPGLVIPHPTIITPTGYLRCNGGELSKVSYSALYAAIGDKFGSYLTQGSGKPWEQQNAFNNSEITDITGWTNGTPMITGVGSHQAIVTKNRVYLITNAITSGSLVATVYTAPINSDGSLGAWVTGTALPAAYSYAKAFITKNRVYVLGGYSGTTVRNYVYTAPINEDGTLGTWVAGTNLPIPGHYSSVFVTRNRVYWIAGRTSGDVPTNAVYTAPINEDGTLGTWVAGPSLPGSLYAGIIIVTKSKVYHIGGTTNSAPVSSVYSANIGADGVIDNWVIDTSFPVVIQGASVAVIKNRAFMIGGYSNSNFSNVVRSAPINADGTLGAWGTITPLPEAIAASQLIILKDKVYLIGGNTANGNNQNIVKIANFPGGTNDYSSFYDGTIQTVINPNNFRIPDYTLKETDELKYYIKY